MVQLALFVGKIAFLVVLYAFLVFVVRSINRDLGQAAMTAWGGEVGRASRGRPAGDVSTVTAAGELLVAPSGTGSWVLVVKRAPGRRKGEAILLSPGSSLLVGRAPDCDLELADSFVSAHHAEFNVGLEGLTVCDLGSTNGTFVNGAPVEGPLLLAPGDEVAIGDSLFVVEARQ